MKVKAITDGFYAGARRRAGAIFEVPDGTKSKWFVSVEEAEQIVAKVKPVKKGKAAAEPETFSELAKTATPQELEVI